MANVLILFHQPIIDKLSDIVLFYESLAKELQKDHNTCLCVNTLFLKEYDSATITKLSNSHKHKFICDMQEFSPDIILTFNNQITEEIINNTNCPICVFDADSVDLFCSGAKNFIKSYKERFYMFSFSYGWESIDRYVEMGFDKKHIEFLHLATSIKREKVANISFIGSYFGYGGTLRDMRNARYLYELIIKSYLDNEINYKNILNKIPPPLLQKEGLKSMENIYALFDTRTLVLNSLLDLGLNLYGKGFKELRESVLLKLAFIDEPIFSLKHNQDIYNSSKINISISHPQCRGYAFPWRIYDIMASNGLLISSYSKLLEEQTKGIVKIPMYKNPYDARDLCKYALNNPNYCEDIILASNEFIEKNGRWKDNFEKISILTGVAFFQRVDSYLKVEKLKSVKIAQFDYHNCKTIKIYIKCMFYRMLIFCFKILFPNRDITDEKVNRLVKKINRYKNSDKTFKYTSQDEIKQ